MSLRFRVCRTFNCKSASAHANTRHNCTDTAAVRDVVAVSVGVVNIDHVLYVCTMHNGLDILCSLMEASSTSNLCA